MGNDSKIVDLSERLTAKLQDQQMLQANVEDQMLAKNMLVEAIDRMREIVDDRAVVRLLNDAIEVLQS